MNKIIAIVGMCGVGKSVAVEYFEKVGFKKVYFGGITLEKMQEQNISITPENEKAMREGLRKEYGMGAYATLSLPKINNYVKESNVVIDGLYSWAELKILNEEYGQNLTIIAVIADKNIRYQRLSERIVRPHTKDEAINRDLGEIENMDKGGPIAYADYFATNNGTVEELEVRLKEILDNN